MAGPVAASGCLSFPTLASSSSHGSDSYTLLLYALFVEPTFGLGARWVAILMSRRCHLPHDLRYAQSGVLGLDQPILRSRRNLGISSVPLLLIECRCFSRSPILFPPPTFALTLYWLRPPPSAPSLQGTVHRLPLSPTACAAIPPAFAPPQGWPASWPSFSLSPQSACQAASALCPAHSWSESSARIP